MTIRAGDLDRRITLQRATVVRGSDNAATETWADIATVSASKEDVSDGERFRAAQVEANVTTRFVIRYSSLVEDLNSKDRLVFAGRIYDIFGVKEVGKREGLEITAAARADE